MMTKAFLLCLCICGAASAAPQQIGDVSWGTSKWTRPTPKLTEIRNEIESLAAKPLELEKEIANAEKRCAASKPTHDDLFRWSCAVMTRMRGDFDFWRKLDGSSSRKKPLELFRTLTLPDSYEFTRIRFLVAVTFEFPHRSLIPVGERLLEKQPKDLPVSLALLPLYQPQAFPADRERGEELVRAIDRNFAPNTFILASTGYFYYRCWTKSRLSSDSAQALRRSGEARKGIKSLEQRRLIDAERREMLGGSP